MNLEKAALYSGGAIAVAISLWVFVAFLRAEDMLDLKAGLFCAGFFIFDTIWRKRRRSV